MREETGRWRNCLEARAPLNGPRWTSALPRRREPHDIPLISPRYRPRAAAAAAALNDAANAATIAANDANANADLFVLHTVMFAIALFFLGTASVVHFRAMRWAMSVLGAVAVVLSTLSMTRLPRAPRLPPVGPI